MKKALAISVFDQAVLSLMSLGLGVVLIRLATPEALGQFTVAQSVFFVFGGIQYALVALPISTRIFGRALSEQADILGAFGGFWLVLTILVTLASVPLMLFFGLSGAQTAVGVAMVATSLWRELSRSVHLALGHATNAFAMDLAATLITLAAIAGLWQVMPPVQACLGGLALGNGLAAGLLGPHLFITKARVSGALGFYRNVLPLTRWSLGDSLSAELQTRGYVFLVQIARGGAANGLLQATRILFSPVAMVAQAWARVAVPRLAADIRAGKRRGAIRTTLINMAMLTGFALIYCGVIYLGWGWVNALLFAGKYDGVGDIAIGWAAFSILSAPSASLVMLFQAMERFRELALIGIGNTIMVLGLVAAGAAHLPLYAVLGALAFGQAAVVISLGILLAREVDRRRELTA